MSCCEIQQFLEV